MEEVKKKKKNELHINFGWVNKGIKVIFYIYIYLKINFFKK